MTDKRALVQDMYDKITGASDMDWSEINEKHGCDLHIDQLRKMGAGLKLVIEAGMFSGQPAAGEAPD